MTHYARRKNKLELSRDRACREIAANYRWQKLHYEGMERRQRIIEKTAVVFAVALSIWGLWQPAAMTVTAFVIAGAIGLWCNR